MPNVSIATRNGRPKTLDAAAVDAFRSRLRGELLLAGDAGYDAARALWNAMIDRRPALIARCAGAADVIQCVKLAREHDLLASVRGAGHNIAGMAAADGALMIDLSRMREVRVDPVRRIAYAGPGATLRDLDHETQAFGLATPVGINSTTGIAGLTLGGGFGWITRKFGLTVDNLLSADVVTAEGKLIRTSEKEEPDLFWGIRGGGGNLGIVTSFEYRLHPVGPEVLSGLIVHPFTAAGDVLREWRSFVSKASEELTCWVVMRAAPPLPFLPPEWHGKGILALAVCYVGDMKAGEKALQPLRQFGKPIADVVAPNPFTAWQQAFDPLLAPGARNYWKSHNFATVPDAAIDTLLKYAAQIPSPESEIFLGQLGGAAGRVARDAMAYPHRDANFVMNVHTRWQHTRDDSKCIAWAREIYEGMTPFATGGVYVNFVSEGEERVKAAYGANYDRLMQLKGRYDPTNLFRLNQNVQPAVRS
jgi:FAD/FMN-containing dehydrogenase